MALKKQINLKEREFRLNKIRKNKREIIDSHKHFGFIINPKSFSTSNPLEKILFDFINLDRISKSEINKNEFLTRLRSRFSKTKLEIALEGLEIEITTNSSISNIEKTYLLSKLKRLTQIIEKI